MSHHHSHHSLPTHPSSFSSKSSSNSLSDPSPDSNVYCFCRRPDDGSPMIECDYPLCVSKWFHLNCLKMTIQQAEIITKFICSECEQRENKFKIFRDKASIRRKIKLAMKKNDGNDNYNHAQRDIHNRKKPSSTNPSSSSSSSHSLSSTSYVRKYHIRTVEEFKTKVGKLSWVNDKSVNEDDDDDDMSEYYGRNERDEDIYLTEGEDEIITQNHKHSSQIRTNNHSKQPHHITIPIVNITTNPQVSRDRQPVAMSDDDDDDDVEDEDEDDDDILSIPSDHENDHQYTYHSNIPNVLESSSSSSSSSSASALSTPLSPSSNPHVPLCTSSSSFSSPTLSTPSKHPSTSVATPPSSFSSSSTIDTSIDDIEDITEIENKHGNHVLITHYDPVAHASVLPSLMIFPPLPPITFASECVLPATRPIPATSITSLFSTSVTSSSTSVASLSSVLSSLPTLYSSCYHMLFSFLHDMINHNFHSDLHLSHRILSALHEGNCIQTIVMQKEREKMVRIKQRERERYQEKMKVEDERDRQYFGSLKDSTEIHMMDDEENTHKNPLYHHDDMDLHPDPDLNIPMDIPIPNDVRSSTPTPPPSISRPPSFSSHTSSSSSSPPSPSLSQPPLTSLPESQSLPSSLSSSSSPPSPTPSPSKRRPPTRGLSLSNGVVLSSGIPWEDSLARKERERERLKMMEMETEDIDGDMEMDMSHYRSGNGNGNGIGNEPKESGVHHSYNRQMKIAKTLRPSQSHHHNGNGIDFPPSLPRSSTLFLSSLQSLLHDVTLHYPRIAHFHHHIPHPNDYPYQSTENASLFTLWCEGCGGFIPYEEYGKHMEGCEKWNGEAEREERERKEKEMERTLSSSSSLLSSPLTSLSDVMKYIFPSDSPILNHKCFTFGDSTAENVEKYKMIHVGNGKDYEESKISQIDSKERNSHWTTMDSTQRHDIDIINMSFSSHYHSLSLRLKAFHSLLTLLHSDIHAYLSSYQMEEWRVETFKLQKDKGANSISSKAVNVGEEKDLKRKKTESLIKLSDKEKKEAYQRRKLREEERARTATKDDRERERERDRDKDKEKDREKRRRSRSRSRSPSHRSQGHHASSHSHSSHSQSHSHSHHSRSYYREEDNEERDRSRSTLRRASSSSSSDHRSSRPSNPPSPRTHNHSPLSLFPLSSSSAAYTEFLDSVNEKKRKRTQYSRRVFSGVSSTSASTSNTHNHSYRDENSERNESKHKSDRHESNHLDDEGQERRKISRKNSHSYSSTEDGRKEREHEKDKMSHRVKVKKEEKEKESDSSHIRHSSLPDTVSSSSSTPISLLSSSSSSSPSSSLLPLPNGLPSPPVVSIIPPSVVHPHEIHPPPPHPLYMNHLIAHPHHPGMMAYPHYLDHLHHMDPSTYPYGAPGTSYYHTAAAIPMVMAVNANGESSAMGGTQMAYYYPSMPSYYPSSLYTHPSTITANTTTAGTSAAAEAASPAPAIPASIAAGLSTMATPVAYGYSYNQ